MSGRGTRSSSQQQPAKKTRRRAADNDGDDGNAAQPKKTKNKKNSESGTNLSQEHQERAGVVLVPKPRAGASKNNNNGGNSCNRREGRGDVGNENINSDRAGRRGNSESVLANNSNGSGYITAGNRSVARSSATIRGDEASRNSGAGGGGMQGANSRDNNRVVLVAINPSNHSHATSSLTSHEPHQLEHDFVGAGDENAAVHNNHHGEDEDEEEEEEDEDNNNNDIHHGTHHQYYENDGNHRPGDGDGGGHQPSFQSVDPRGERNECNGDRVSALTVTPISNGRGGGGGDKKVSSKRAKKGANFVRWSNNQAGTTTMAENKRALQRYVRETLFTRVKFITSDVELELDGMWNIKGLCLCALYTGQVVVKV